MAKDKIMIAREEGMMYALRVAKEKGVEGLEADIKRRGLTNAPIKYSKKEIDDFWSFMCENCYSNTIACAGYTLHEIFGFGGKRLKRFMQAFNKFVQDTQDLDWLGEHYVKISDYALMMNERYGLDISVERIDACTDLQDETDSSNFHYLKAERLIEEMKEAGLKDAAEWLERKVS